MLTRIKGKKLTIVLAFITLVVIFFQVWSASLNVELSRQQYSNLLHELEILERGDLVNNRMTEITKEIEILTLMMVADEYFGLGINRTQFRDERYKPTLEECLERIDFIQGTLDERDNLSENLYENFTKEFEFRMFVNSVNTVTSILTIGFILILFATMILDYFKGNMSFGIKKQNSELKKDEKKINYGNKKLKKDVKLKELCILKEPLDLKAKAYDSYKSDPRYNRDSFWLWSDHKFPKYLWHNWGNTLKVEYSISYGEFLKILGGPNTIELRKWVRKEINWEDFIEKIINSIQRRTKD